MRTASKTDNAPSSASLEVSIAQRLAQSVVATSYDELSAAELDRIEACTLYAFTVAMAYHGTQDRAQQAAPKVYCAQGESSLIGSKESRSALDAAAINGALITARSQTDTHPDSGGHIGCVVIPAVLALAQERGTSPRDVIAALVAGYEVPPRVGRSIVPVSTARGFRGTSLYGVFGSAAGCCRVLGLSVDKTAHALAIAANLSGGLVQCYEEGTPEAVIQVAEASRAGVLAALLAERGLIAADRTFEGPKGFYKAYGDEAPNLGPLTSTISGVVFKPSPGCVINQMPVLTLLKVMKRERLGAQDIRGITVYLHPQNAHYAGIGLHGPFPSKQGAIMSAAFMLQIALENGRVTMRDLLERFGPDPIHERSQQVKVVADPSIAEQFTCILEVTLQNGSSFKEVSPKSDFMAFDTPQASTLCREIAEEWSTETVEEDFRTLRSAVSQLIRAQDPRSILTLFEATDLAR